MIVILVAILVCIVAGLYIYGRWNFGTLEKYGIPVVPHHPLLGNTREHYTRPGGLEDIRLMKKYGQIYGVYEGRTPLVFINVPELVRLICVKDAEYFNAKRDLDFGDPILNEMPDFQPYDKWKLIRSLATPVFTSAKIKMMNMPMKEATIDFVEEMKQKIRASGKGVCENVPIDLEIHAMLTDLIGRCVFSMRMNEKGSNNPVALLVKELVKSPAEESALKKELIIWSHTYPFLRRFLGATIFGGDATEKLVPIFRQMMKERRATGKHYNDIIDLCMEWMDRLDTPEFKKAQMSELSIMCQALVFFFATQDQVATMTACLIYHMTQKPEIEKKVYEEVDRVFAKHGGKIEHENLNELVYLNACLNECLRLYAFFNRLERVCTKEWKNEEYNLHFKPGQAVILPIWSINRNSEYNENGEEYNPERFMPENKDKLNIYATGAFGHGPRNCTGKRFATEVLPLVSAYILKDLKFKKRSNTNLTWVPGGPFMQPHLPIHVDVVERSK